jgi:16S rRNA (cytidine1402-2'-O)-methyltransferase
MERSDSMERRQNYQNDKATLYLIPTPIGNLKDMTFRAVEIMQSVDILFAEDTRVTRKLLTHFAIKTDLKSYHEHNKTIKTEVIIDYLKAGKSVGLCSDAGMPLVSDPGFEAGQAAFVAGFNVVALPGASAGITGLVMSGFRAHPHLFYGFLDSKSGKRQAELKRLQMIPDTLIFYEAPHRIKDTLLDVEKVLGDRQAVIAREISKKFEEVIRGRLSELAVLDDIQGEIVLIVEGFNETIEVKDLRPLSAAVDDLISQGMTKSEAMKKVASKRGITKSVVYREYLQNHE